MPLATPQGTLDFKSVDTITFVGASSNTVIDTTTGSFGVGVDGNGPTSNLHVVGDALITGNVAVTGTGSLTNPSGTTAQRPGTGVAGMVRFNIDTTRMEYYDGTQWVGIGGISATGGTITEVNGYRIHTFTTDSTFTVVSGGSSSEYLVVAGGGGAPGRDVGGGGGGGGVKSGNSTFIAGSYSISVGVGGSGKYDSISDLTGMKGGNSSIGALVVSTGGGGGRAHHADLPNSEYNGGSGGGGSGITYITSGTGISEQGSDGGDGIYYVDNATYYGGGGGGGAGGVGANALSGRHGGIGIQSAISGTNVYYGGGGGGAGHRSSGNGTQGNGGSGGGGPCNQSSTTSDRNGTDGLGGGGGASRNTGLTGGDGGDGIVIIRYLL